MSNQTGSTNFSRVLAYFFTQTPVERLAKNHVCRPCEKTPLAELPRTSGLPAPYSSPTDVRFIGGLYVPFLRTGGKRDHAARARARAGGGDMFLRMVSSCVVNLGCQTFEIHQFCILGVKRFASREHRTRDILPENSLSVVPLCH